MVNAWRNAPIQGGVADIMLVSYAMLHERLSHRPTAWPVQTVHDSVVVECDRDEAEVVMIEVAQSLEEASLVFCPDVTPKADVDIRTTLADSDVVKLYEPNPSADVLDRAEGGVVLGEPPASMELAEPDLDAELAQNTPEPVQLQLGLG